MAQMKTNTYNFNWYGKKDAVHTATSPPKSSFDSDLNYKNIFIEGENIDSLKLLKRSHENKIKIIYIDPPYNTGNCFVYNDSFKNSNRNISEFDKNHSTWLNMMYPRLLLAKELLRDDGVIFISIGIEELSNLKMIMDEIFGEKNFIELFSWVKTSTPPSLSVKSRKTVEYVLCYEKNKDSFKYKGELLTNEDATLLNSPNKISKLYFPKDKVFFSFIENGVIQTSENQNVRITSDIVINNHYSEKDLTLEGHFKWSQDFLNKEIEKGTTFCVKSNRLTIYYKRITSGHKTPNNMIKNDYIEPILSKETCGVLTNNSASSYLKCLMGAEVFSYPKPVSLVKHLLSFKAEKDDIVLDFFGGSGTTAEAVMRLNSETGLNLGYVIIQKEEILDKNPTSKLSTKTINQLLSGIALCDKLGYTRSITTLAKERIKRAGENILAGEYHKSWDKDVSFKVIKLLDNKEINNSN